MRLKAFVFVATLLAAQTAFAPTATFKPVEGNLPPFEAQFNPKEVQVDKSIPWTKQKKSTDDSPALEYSGGEPKILQVELMFDTYESKEDVNVKYINRLQQFVELDKTTKRPPMTTFVWGRGFQFKGVIEQLNVKYTLFLDDGTPVRATADVKMKQADSVSTKKEPDKDKD